jgi:hypothetical protein
MDRFEWFSEYLLEMCLDVLMALTCMRADHGEVLDVDMAKPVRD